MKFPATEHELKQAGYVAKSKAHCLGKNCSVLLHWYQTPAGKMMPLSQKSGEPGIILEPHFATCHNAQDFRKEKRD
jgi:hypothetical protein